MGYINDVIDIIALKEETYKKLGNDPNAFQRYTIAYLLIQYIILFLICGLVGIIFAALIPEIRTAIVKYWYIIIAAFLIVPILGYGLNLVALGIKYGIGLCFGGKPKSFKDFVAVADYISPVIMPFLFIPVLSSIVAILYTVWKYVILYKTYQIIHKLDAKRAGWAVGINVSILAIIMISFMVMYFGFIFALIASDAAEENQPDVITDTIEQEYGVFYSFDEQIEEREMIIEMESSEEINIYVVKSRADFNNFMDDEDFNVYDECYFEEVFRSTITCTVTSGGIIIYNPGEYTAEYTITTT